MNEEPTTGRHGESPESETGHDMATEEQGCGSEEPSQPVLALRTNEWMKAMPLPMMTLDRAGRVLSWNERAEEMFGWKAEEVIGRSSPLVFEEDWDFFLSRLTIVLDGRLRSSREHRVRRSDGSLMQARIHASAVSAADGKTTVVLALVEDISEQKKTEEELRRRELLYRQVFETNQAMKLLIDPESGAILDANEAALRFYGYSREEILAKNIAEINILSKAEIEAEMARARKEERLVFHFRHRLASGEIRDVEVYSGPVVLDGRTLLYSIVHDITERKRMQEALEESESRFRLLVNHAPAGLYEIDFLRDRFISVNDVICRYLGYSREELLEIPASSCLSSDSRRDYLERLQNMAMGKQVEEQVEYRIKHRDGRDIWVNLNARYTWKDGIPVGALVVVHDITERKVYEEKLRESESRLRTQYESLPVPTLTWQHRNGNFFLMDFNSAARDLTGDGLQKYIGEESDEFFSYRPDLNSALQACFREGKPQVRETFYRMKTTGEGKFLKMTFVLAPPDLVMNHIEDLTEQWRTERRRRESEARFRAVFETAKDSIFIKDRSLHYVEVNPAMEGLFGHPAEELLGRTDLDLFGPGSGREVLESDLEVMNGHVVEHEHTQSINGEFHTFHIVKVPMFLESGEIAGLCGIARDVTERKRAEEELKESHERLLLVLENLDATVYVADMETHEVLYANKHARSVFGEDLLGRICWREIFGLNEGPCGFCRKENLLAPDGTPSGVHKVEFPDERTGRWFFIRNQAVRWLDGRLVRLTITQDVTEQKEYETRLRESEEKYRNILESIDDGYFEVDLSGHFIFSNDSMCRLLGYSRAELLGMSYRDFMDDTGAGQVYRHFNRVYRTGEPAKSLVWTMRRKNGSEYFSETSISLIRDTSSRPTGFRGLSRDVTERRRAEAALFESELKFRTIFEHSADGISVFGVSPLDMSLRLVDCNESFVDMSGRTREELFSSKDIDMLRTKINESESGNRWKSIKSGKPYAGTYSWRRLDGRENYMEYRAVPVRIGSQIFIYVIDRDITARRRAEEALRESEEKYRNLFDHAQVGMFRVEAGTGRWLEVNSKMAEILGYPSAQDMKSKTIWSVFSDAAEGRQMMEHLEQNGFLSDHHKNVLRPDGERRDCLCSIRHYPDKGFFEGSCVDISARLRAEEALRQSEQRFASFFSLSPVSLGLSTLREGLYLDVNQAFLELTGYGRDELAGRNFLDLGIWADQEERDKMFTEISNEGCLRGQEIRIRHKNGQIKTALMSAELIIIKSEESILFSLMDITNLKAATEKLAAQRKQLRRLATELAVTESRERRRIAADLHDRIGQTLFLAHLRTEQMRDWTQEPQGLETVEVISELLEQAIGDVRALLMEMSPPILQVLGLEAALKNLGEKMESEHGVKVEVRGECRLLGMSDDLKDLLFRAARELMLNAVKHARAGRILVSLSLEDDAVEVTVEDNGIGFETSEIERLVESASPRFGLFSIRERLTPIGGELRVRSTPGQGTKASLLAPLRTLGGGPDY